MMPGMTYQPGDVLLLPFPFADRNSAKKRPVLLLKSVDSLGDFICLAVTSVPDHSDGFLLNAADFVEGNLPRESWVRTEKAYTLNVSLVLGRFGSLKQDVFAQVHGRFCAAVGCS
jgi:mRNA interferase MazF